MDPETPRTEPPRRGPGPPPDSDLIGFPIVAGLLVAIAAVAAAFIFIGATAGMIALLVVLVLALAVSYRVISSAETND